MSRLLENLEAEILDLANSKTCEVFSAFLLNLENLIDSAAKSLDLSGLREEYFKVLQKYVFYKKRINRNSYITGRTDLDYDSHKKESSNIFRLFRNANWKKLELRKKMDSLGIEYRDLHYQNVFATSPKHRNQF